MDDSISTSTKDNEQKPQDYSSMSIADLRLLLTRRGFDCSVCLEKSDLINAARRLDATNYDEEAHRLFRQLNLQPTLARQYQNLNAIWKHPDTGGTVYVGNATAASNRVILDERNIRAVMNCQGAKSENYFEDDPKFSYHRFVVSTLACRMSLQHRAAQQSPDTPVVMTPLQGGFQQAFDFITTHVELGHSVLIHCLAGAHRAGTVGTAWIMYKTGQDVQTSLALAKKCRPIISPFGLLLELLHYLETELQNNKNQT